MSGALAFTRTEGRPTTGRDPTIPRFHLEPVEDYAASAAAGRPIFTHEERVQLINPGNPSSPVERVTDEHRRRWPEQYAAFKAGLEPSLNGTPLEQWPILNRGQVLEMKALNIHTVEQCADLNDLAIQRIGRGARRIKELAQAYLDDAKHMSVTSEAVERAERAEARVAALEAQLSELRPMLDKMHTEMMTMRNAPSAIATYVPAEHDPIAAAAQAQPAPAISQSSLSNLPEPRRRGRPPGSGQSVA